MSIGTLTQKVSNIRLSFGGDSNTWFYFYANPKPNKFQRWMLRKVFGIVMEDV
jgi:hypothetical protein